MIKTALTILAVAGTGFFAHGGEPGDAVATVDGQAIEQQEFDRWMTIACFTEPPSTSERPYLKPSNADPRSIMTYW